MGHTGCPQDGLPSGKVVSPTACTWEHLQAGWAARGSLHTVPVHRGNGMTAQASPAAPAVPLRLRHACGPSRCTGGRCWAQAGSSCHTPAWRNSAGLERGGTVVHFSLPTTSFGFSFWLQETRFKKLREGACKTERGLSVPVHSDACAWHTHP